MIAMTPEFMEDIKTRLQAGDRETIIELLSNGLNLPPMVKTLAYVNLQRMSQAEINALCSKVLAALPLLVENRIDELSTLLTGFGVPGPIIDLIKTYGTHNNH
jgi:hypothetical protein